LFANRETAFSRRLETRAFCGLTLKIKTGKWAKINRLFRNGMRANRFAAENKREFQAALTIARLKEPRRSAELVENILKKTSSLSKWKSRRL
jgi:hypothetical protein